MLNMSKNVVFKMLCELITSFNKGFRQLITITSHIFVYSLQCLCLNHLLGFNCERSTCLVNALGISQSGLCDIINTDNIMLTKTVPHRTPTKTPTNYMYTMLYKLFMIHLEGDCTSSISGKFIVITKWTTRWFWSTICISNYVSLYLSD
jgi:hypothetical protein